MRSKEEVSRLGVGVRCDNLAAGRVSAKMRGDGAAAGRCGAAASSRGSVSDLTAAETQHSWPPAAEVGTHTHYTLHTLHTGSRVHATHYTVYSDHHNTLHTPDTPDTILQITCCPQQQPRPASTLDTRLAGTSCVAHSWRPEPGPAPHNSPQSGPAPPTLHHRPASPSRLLQVIPCFLSSVKSAGQLLG